MGIDFGSKRLGIAVSDPSTTLAQPVTVIDRSVEPDYLAALAKLIKEYDVYKIVVGYPRTLGGAVGPQAAAVDKFIDNVEEALSISVVRYDERLSSKEAMTWLAQMGIHGQKAKLVVDKTAAALILQSYLDREAGRMLS